MQQAFRKSGRDRFWLTVDETGDRKRDGAGGYEGRKSDCAKGLRAWTRLWDWWRVDQSDATRNEGAPPFSIQLPTL